MWSGSARSSRELAADDSLRCVVMRGAGDQGLRRRRGHRRIRERARQRRAGARSYGDAIERTMRALARCRHPMVAMIHGACVGGGLEIASQVRPAHLRRIEPFRHSDQQARPGDRLRRNAGADRARRPGGARWRSCSRAACSAPQEAKEKGLVNRVVPDDKVEEEAYASARRIAEGAPLVARWHKKFINRLMDPKPLTRRGTRRELRLLRHRGLPHRPRHLPRQEEA